MPKIPDWAKQPSDHQAAQIKPEVHAEGWDLLRNPIDLEFWEVTDFTALVAEIPVRGEKVKLDAEGLRAVGKVVKTMQEVFAKNSTDFRTWVRSGSNFTESAEKLLPLIFEYGAALGEALRSDRN